MDDDTIQFLPFHALNNFMRDDYRLEVVRKAVHAMPDLPEDHRSSLERQIRQSVRVPGFRNSSKAPASLKVKPAAEAFEKNPALVAAVLYAWAETVPDLRQRVYDLLQARQWPILPPEADRTQLPGFMPTWPKGEDFDILNEAYAEMYPDDSASSDDVSLMIVWLSARLPYSFEGEDEPEEDGDEDAGADEAA